MAGRSAAVDVALSQLSEVCGLLSDPTRLKIMLALAKGERNVNSLCDEFKLLQPTVSHHLGLLRMNRLAVAKRKGKQVFYSLDTSSKAAGGKLKIAVAPYMVTLEGY